MSERDIEHLHRLNSYEDSGTNFFDYESQLNNLDQESLLQNIKRSNSPIPEEPVLLEGGSILDNIKREPMCISDDDVKVEDDLKLAKEIIDKILNDKSCVNLINVKIVTKIKEYYENDKLDGIDDDKFGVFVDKIINITKRLNLN